MLKALAKQHLFKTAEFFLNSPPDLSELYVEAKAAPYSFGPPRRLNFMTTEEKKADIKNHPEQHRHHDMNELARCCTSDGAIVMYLIDMHEGLAAQKNYHGYRNRCDVESGPCACGAWH